MWKGVVKMCGRRVSSSLTLNYNINYRQFMRIDSPNIGWHGLKDRILSIDFHPFANEFASAGSD